MTEAHPLRCETCTTIECFHHPSNWKEAITEYKNSAHYAHGFTTEVGCASHSSAKSDAVLDELDELRHYANGEYKESDVSDNEREMRIHLEYENRIWGIIKKFRSQQKER